MWNSLFVEEDYGGKKDTKIAIQWGSNPQLEVIEEYDSGALLTELTSDTEIHP